MNLSEGVHGDLFEFHTDSFVIKIWLEETAEEAGTVLWRGQITHIPSSRQGYFMHLSDIPLFILPYLQSMGVCPAWQWRAIAWLKWK